MQRELNKMQFVVEVEKQFIRLQIMPLTKQIPEFAMFVSLY